MDDTVSTIGTTRRNLLGAMAATPVIAAAGPIISPSQADLDTLQRRFGVQKVSLLRTQEGREASAFRYCNAHQFFPDARKGQHERANFLYSAGITAQLALSSHLLDVGFPDAWCARFIGLRVAWSLAYANATGLGHDCPRMHKLSRVLHPYWKWNAASQIHRRKKPNTGGFEPDEVQTLLAALLKQVRLVTGHTATPAMLLREERA